MGAKKSRYLIKDDGSVYPFTERLAKRKDMTVFDGTLKQALRAAGKPGRERFPEPVVLGENVPKSNDDSEVGVSDGNNGGNDRLDAIRDAINMLDKQNPEHYTADGKPRVAAIEQIMGDDITQDERDMALEDEPGPGLGL